MKTEIQQSQIYRRTEWETTYFTPSGDVCNFILVCKLYRCGCKLSDVAIVLEIGLLPPHHWAFYQKSRRRRYAVHNEPTVSAVGFEADDFCQIILMMNLLATCLIWFVIAWGILFLFRNEKYSQINHDQFRQIHRITVTDPQEYFLQSVFWENVIARVIGSFWIFF